MAKKPFINRLRVFMAVGSLVGFAGGWTLLAQSGAPASAADTTTAIVVSAQAQPSDFIEVAPSATAVPATDTPAATATTAASTSATATATATAVPTATATRVTQTTAKTTVLRTKSS